MLGEALFPRGSSALSVGVEMKLQASTVISSPQPTDIVDGKRTLVLAAGN